MNIRLHRYSVERKQLAPSDTFVEQAMSMAEEQMDRINILRNKGFNLEIIADRVSSVMALDASEIWKRGKSRRRVAARRLLCFWAERELCISMTELSRKLDLSVSSVSQSVTRGEKIAEEYDFKLLEY
jgi:putative transposase